MAHLPNVFPSMTAREAAGAMRPAPEWARALGAAHARFERMRALTERAVVPEAQFERGAQQAVEPALTMPEAQGENPPVAAGSAQRVDEQGANVEQSQVVSDRRRATDDTARMSEAIAELRAEVARMKSAAAEPMRFTAARGANGRWDISTVGDD